MKTTVIPTMAIQEFYDELDELMKSQPTDWQATPADQKALLVSPSDFDYYLKIRQQYETPVAIAIDDEGIPMVYFLGIRVKPFPFNNTPLP